MKLFVKIKFVLLASAFFSFQNSFSSLSRAEKFKLAVIKKGFEVLASGSDYANKEIAFFGLAGHEAKMQKIADSIGKLNIQDFPAISNACVSCYILKSMKTFNLYLNQGLSLIKKMELQNMLSGLSPEEKQDLLLIDSVKTSRYFNFSSQKRGDQRSIISALSQIKK